MTDHRLIRMIASVVFASGALSVPSFSWAEGGGADKASMFQAIIKQDVGAMPHQAGENEVDEAQIMMPLPPKRPLNLDISQAVPSPVVAAPAVPERSAPNNHTVRNEGALSEALSTVVAVPMPPERPVFAADTAQTTPSTNQVSAPAQFASAPMPGVSFSRVSLSTPSVATPQAQTKTAEPVVPIFTSVPLPPQRPQLVDLKEDMEAPVAVVAQKPRPVEVQKFSVIDSGDRPVNFFQQSFEKVPEPQDSATMEAPANPRIMSKLNNVIGDDPRRAGELRSLINKHASENGIPFKLADAVVRIESRYNSGARNGPYMGLMQIHPSTARSLGYSGDSSGLLDPDTNLRYGIKYLAMAYRLANGDTCGTIMRYQGGHRAVTMSSSAQKYCSKIKMIFAENQF